MTANKFILIILTGTVFILSNCCTVKWTQLEKEKSSIYLQKFLTDSTHNAIKSEILIPDEETAIRIAEIFLFKIYGKRKIIKEKPYKIGLVDDYWVIVGTLPKYYIKGGNFEIIINSKDGSIKGISHSK